MTADPEFDETMRSLTEAQKRVLGLIAMNQDQFHHPKVLSALVALGLIVRTEETLPGRFPVRVNRYHVPLPLHYRYCEWCSRWAIKHSLEDGDEVGRDDARSSG